MRSARTLGSRIAGFALAFVAWIAFAPAAQALSVPFTFEFDDGDEGDFGTVRVEEDGSGGLFFEITLGPDLGSDADLHFFYFNLLPDLDDDDLRITSTDAVFTPYELEEEPRVRGGAGSEFDFAVFFGNGAGRKGNGNLGSATFTISSDSTSLRLSDLLELSSTSQGLEAHFAAHVQSTSSRSDSETIGAIVPEPTTSILLGLGLLGLGLAGRRPS